MKEIQQIKEFADILRLTNLRNNAEEVVHRAQIDNPSYLELVLQILRSEVEQRQQSDKERRLKAARLLKNSDLDRYDFNFSCGIDRQQMRQLRELVWVEQAYNLVLMGPSGTGKSYIASGLVSDAVNKGYRAYFMTMEDLVYILRTKDMVAASLSAYNRLLKANLVAIDDIMMFPVKKVEATAFFNLINHLHEQCSVIITTNKSPQQWAEALDDEVLVTALLDRLLFHCQVVKLQGSSYRMENRRDIFENAEEVSGLATAATPPPLQPLTSSKQCITDEN